MTMSKKAGTRTQKSNKSTTKTKKKSLPTIPIWNDDMITTILNNSHDGIVILGEEYTFEYINERGLAIYGGSASDLAGKDFRLFMKDDTARMVAEYYEKRRRGEEVPTVYPFRLLRKDGIEVTVEGRVSLVTGPDKKLKVIAHLLDITQMEKDLRALEESKTRYKLLVETMNDGLAIDNEDGELTYVNDAFCRMLGCSSGELIGKHWSDLTEEMTPEDVKNKIEQRKIGLSESYELTWCHKNGDTVPTIVSATPYIDHDGKFAGTFAVITEISDQKNAEESIQFYLDLLSHDIANQLQVIMTSSGLLEQEVPASYIADARQDILDAVDRCNRLITKVKRAGQIRRIPITSVDIVDVIDEKTAVLQRVYNAKIHRTGSKKQVLVEADLLLGELIWNLLENSARHNPVEHKEVWISIKPKGDLVLLSIADNGPGLSDTRKKNLFTERSHAGGVGLKLVRQMIRKYGGSIEVEDRVKGKPNEGVNFAVTFRKAK
ncbi:PAS domain-containing sensor histidine kinase [Candidatus Thorarchaeota archaeon]|nr:MAG: PAS domain-containing sensor histidine kinase [Candidatus Thorarchaeota archaeon]